MLDAPGPAQVFASANEVSHSGAKEPLYEILLVAEAPEITCNSGITLRCRTLSEDGPVPDTVIVAGGSGVNAACERPALLAWARRRAQQVRRMASVCSGAFLLAQAGLLDGRRAVTHWHRWDEFAGRFPQVRLERDPIFLRDGPTWASAGVTAGVDLALARRTMAVRRVFVRRLGVAPKDWPERFRRRWLTEPKAIRPRWSSQTE